VESQKSADATKDGGSNREEGKQNPLTNVGAPPDPNGDSNERADDRARIVEPDGSPSPRA
jgi:hypothetical protein